MNKIILSGKVISKNRDQFLLKADQCTFVISTDLSLPELNSNVTIEGILTSFGMEYLEHGYRNDVFIVAKTIS